VTAYSEISLEVDDDGIAVLTLDRPDQLNAYTAQMQVEILAALDETDADDAVRAVVVTGAGRAFCAGADLATSGSDTFNYDELEDKTGQEVVGGVHRDGGGVTVLRVFRSLKPVIAAINGPAVGVGASMTLAMDARLGVHGGKLGFVFARRGLVPDAAASWFLPRLVGIPTALEWCYSGRVFRAEEALAAGLLQSLHDPADVLAAAKALARDMTALSAPVSIALTRQLIWRMAGASHPMHAHTADSRALMIQGASADVAEGVASFLEKRDPVFPRRVSTDLPDVTGWWEEPPFR
jgi:enoyl-CoA hydratase/carnithine racemase